MTDASVVPIPRGNYNPLGLDIGDTVRIKPYTVETLYGDRIEPSDSRKAGILLRAFQDYDWRSAPNMAVLRVLMDSGEAWIVRDRPLTELELVEKGNGTFLLGVTHPFSEKELQGQRLDAWRQKWADHDRTHQGYSNAATFCAWVQLQNNSSCLDQLHRMRRKDGTINPDKVAKLFRDSRFTVDAWALDCCIDIPAEFEHHRWRYRERVNWAEVAAEFAETRAGQ